MNSGPLTPGDQRIDVDLDDVDTSGVETSDEGARTQRPRRLRDALIGIAQLLLVVAVVAAAIALTRQERSVARGPASGASGSTTLVEVIHPAATDASIRINLTGTVTTRTRVSLTTQVTGRVIAVAPVLRDGGEFRAGQILLRVDPQDFELALAQSRAELDGAIANLKLVQAESDAAVENYALLNGNARVPLLVARTPQIAQARAQIAAARARFARGALDLRRTSFSLPFDGRITASSADVGQLLTAGAPFGEAFALDAVEVTAPISRNELQRLAPAVGRRAVIRSEQSQSDVPVEATVERVGAVLDQQTRFARLFLKPGVPQSLPPGAFVEITVDGPAIASTFTLPTTTEQSDSRLWVVRDNQLVEVIPVIHARGRDTITVASFDPGQGIVNGVIPGALPGLPVQVAPR